MGLIWDKHPDLADPNRYWDFQPMGPLPPVPDAAGIPSVFPAPATPVVGYATRLSNGTGHTAPRPDRTAEILDLLRDIKNELRLLRLDTGC